MLSVIVPIYNVEHYLPKCIESIVNQTYQQLEIILIDDGSTDSCPQICDRYAQRDHRIKVIHKRNGGLVQARKTGLNRASGSYIAFVDGDDWIEPNMYLNLVEAMETSNADFLDSSYFCDKEEKYYIERKSQGIYILDLYVRDRFFKSLLGLDNFIRISPSIWSKVFKADVIKDSYMKVPDDMQHGEDVINLVHCILRSGKILQVEEAFYHYNYREESMSHFKSISYLRKELMLWNYCGSIILKHDDFIKQKDLDSYLFKKIFTIFSYLIKDEIDVIHYYTFPHIELLLDKKIVIYGAGNVGKDYVTQISKYEKCEIVCWVDKNYKELYCKYREVIGVDQLFQKTYDIVVIAVDNKKKADEIKQFLLDKGVSKTKIVWFEPNTHI